MIRELFIPLTCGLAIFLFGMQIMRIGFEQLFLQKIKIVLLKLTKNPMIGMLTGTLTAALIQSSSAVTLIAIALTNARLLTFKQTIGIILGANIGTCLTTEIIAFPIEQFGLPLFIIGAALFLFPSAKSKSSGLVCGGFGLLFVGIQTMQSITPFIKERGWLTTVFLSEGHTELTGLLVGTIATAIIQSSTATTAIMMNLYQEHFITLAFAIAVILGSNIGTCVTGILGSIGGNRAAKQVACAHIILNIGGALLFIPFIGLLGDFVIGLTPNLAMQLAHAQTIFNIVCSLLVLPFVSWFERLVYIIVPN